MSYRIEVAPEFARRLKKLSKRYKSIKQDYEDFLHSLQSNPLQGVDLGKGLRKIRMSIASKGKGKSGGARVISFVAIMNEEDGFIELLTIYDKSEMESISDKELLNLMKRNGLFQYPNNTESCRHHCQQDSLSKTEPKILPCNFYLCNIYCNLNKSNYL